MDLLSLHQPWDCQRFPQSKTICYGRGGGGGGNPVTQIVETVQENVIDPVVETADLPDLKIIPEDLPTLDEIKEKVSDETLDLKIIPEDLPNLAEDVSELSDKISSGTPDLIIDTTGLNDALQGVATGITDTAQVATETLGGITTDILQGDVGTVLQDLKDTTGDFLTNPLGTTHEVLDHNLGQVHEAIDQTVEFIQNPSEVIEKAKDRLSGHGENVKDDLTETAENYKKVVQDIGTTAEEIGKAVTETYQTGLETAAQAGTTAATQVTEAHEDLINALVEAGLLTRRPSNEEGIGNAQAIMAGDPRMLSLMARRNRARKRGKAQLRKGGGLYIPVGTGLQVPA